MSTVRLLGLLCLLGGAAVAVLVLAAEVVPPSPRDAAHKAFAAGNYKDAYEGLAKLALDPKDDPLKVGEDLKVGVDSLAQLGRIDEADEFREKVIEAHKDNWRLLFAAAQSYADGEHNGFIVAGNFRRGNQRGGGRYVSSMDRDRVRALQLMTRAMGKIGDEKDRNAVGDFHVVFARILLNAGYGQEWRLQTLTDLATLPDYEEGYRYDGGQAPGAPVDADGNPIYYRVPKGFEAARSDGERWRSELAQAVEVAPARTAEVRTTFAQFLQSQFGVETMALFGWAPRDDSRKDESGPFAVQSLGEDETIARLATGIKRFKLPDEFNFIKIDQEIADSEKSNWGEAALNALAQIFVNRRQLPKAADYWRRSIREYGPGNDQYKQKALDQIVKNWGRFEPTTVQSARAGTTLDYRFRNGKKVHFEAHAIRVAKLLDDVKAYLKSSPGQLDWNRLNLANIGYRLVEEQQKAYVGDRVAAWDLDLKPRPDHFDDEVTVATPLQKPGAYLVTAQMADGNLSRIILWVGDTTIVKKPLDGKAYYFVADSVTGKPIPKANLEFFGYRQEQIGRTNQFKVITTNFAAFTDADGQATPDVKLLQPEYQWLIIARTDAGRFAFLGFTNVWYGQLYDPEYDQTKVFAITDRPVYRPEQTVKFKFWVRHARYDQEDGSDFANKAFTVVINNPKGEKVLTKTFTADAFGGFDGEFPLPKGTTLGQYSLAIDNLGGGTFRVEEYKKPEFEVSVDAPKEPIMLGETINATIKAKYYFGSPVVEARVKYKVTRTSHDAQWYPPGRWDWFYGPGYWWFAYDYDWYPGWSRWGCRRPHPTWWPSNEGPPEVVMEQEVPIGADGTVKVTIDTGPAKEVHGDIDHQYQISAEVVDQSRRTIVGNGNVMVARKPYKVFAWVDRGYYRAGDVIQANFAARTLDQKPVQGKGTLKLLKVRYDEKQEPVETVAQTWDLDTDAQGRSQVQIKAAEPGQYRLSYTVTDAKEHAIEGGYVFVVRGDRFNGAEFRFNDVELVTDKREYAPGETVRLMVNTERRDGTVVLFLRPSNGVYLMPKVIRLTGKSTVQDVLVVKKDMPNFFIEAFTVADGQLFSETREVVVPPEKRVLNVAVEPSKESYKPGEPAKVKVKLTDFLGKPFVGSTVMTIYDKSVEYIAGGSNVPEIKAFFWKWRRQHYPNTESNLNLSSGELLRSGEIGMQDLGVFGPIMSVTSYGLTATRVPALSRHFAMDASRSMGGMGGMAAGMAAPAASARGDRAEMLAKAPAALGVDFQEGAADKDSGAGPPEVQPTVRKEFADTALWSASLTTDTAGLAEVELKMPENLTGWKVKTWALGQGTKVGEGEAEVVTAKDLLVRLQAPRFFVQTDEVVLSGNVHNYLKTDKSVRAVLELDGPTLEPLDDPARTINVKAGGEQRVDWRVRVVREGQAVVRMKALSDEESDAMEMRFPALVHGMNKMDSFAGAIRPERDSATVTINVPEKRRINDSRVEVRYSPTLAGAMVDALPYLVNYPYGCTEQTLNRFLPTVVTQNVLLRMKLDLKAIERKRTNLNAQEIGDDVERAKQWKHEDRNPVFNADEVQVMVQTGLRDLTSMQLADGGWGWFSGFGEQSYPHTTTLVVHGLQLAKQNDVAIVPGVLENGINWLKTYQVEQVRRLKNFPSRTIPYKEKADNVDAFVFMVLADADVADAEMREFLYRDRTDLAVYGLTMYGLALQKQGQAEKLAMVLRNVEQYLVRDDENQTAYLRLPANNAWWYWYGSEVEAQAYYLKLLARTDPKGETASRLVKYLINNRKHASYWESTRDTSIAIEALADFIKASGEDRPDLTVAVFLDGAKKKEVKINAENLFSFDNAFVLVGDAVPAGTHKIELKRTGTGPLYFNAYVSNFTLEDEIKRAGLEVKVNRKYYKLVERDKTVKLAGSRGQAVDQKVEKYDRRDVPNLATLKSGDLVEIELEIDSKNDYEYLVFEDMKAAGFEPVEVRSGYNGNDMGAYVEFRDEKVCFFARALTRGKHSVSYRLRAEIPGKFSALPTSGYAMYAPELRGNSDEIKVIIED